MATIPLPELSLQPPQQTDLLGQMGKVVALKSALQQQQYQQQMQPLQLQQEQLQVQQQQRSMQSQQALMQALVENPTADPDSLAQQAMKSGAYPGDVLPMVKQLKENQIQTQELRGKTLDNAQKAIDEQGRQAQMLLSIPDPQDRQRAYQSQTIPAMQQIGIPPNLIPQQVPDDLTLKAHAAAATNADKYLNTAREQQAYEQQHGIIDPNRLRQINNGMTQFAQVYGKNASDYVLPQGSTWDDYKRVDGMMERTEKATQSKAQFDAGLAIRQGMQSLAQLAAQEKIAQLNKPTSDEQKRYEMADNLEENLNGLVAIAQRRPELFGKVGARMLWEKLVGTDDPDVGALETLKHQLGMAQASAHSMRGAQVVAAAADSLVNNFKNGPQAIIGSAQTALNSVQTFRDDTDKARAGRLSGITPQMGPMGTQVQANQQQAKQQQNLPGAGKFLTSAQIAAKAKQNSMTYSNALSDAKSQGYEVRP